MIIGITGPSGSGKSTLAAALKVAAPYSLTALSFADPIRHMLLELGLTVEQLRGLKEVSLPEYGVTPRYMMQTLGYEWGRQAIHPDVWLRHLQMRARAYNHVVVDDVRFENEAAWVRKNGRLIHVMWGRGPDAHASESGVSMGAQDLRYTRGDNVASLIKAIYESA